MFFFKILIGLEYRRNLECTMLITKDKKSVIMGKQILFRNVCVESYTSVFREQYNFLVWESIEQVIPGGKIHPITLRPTGTVNDFHVSFFLFKVYIHVVNSLLYIKCIGFRNYLYIYIFIAFTSFDRIFSS